jgi:hypothetical protein
VVILKCQQCGMDAYMGFTCKRCGGYFCTKDHLPEHHNCAFRNMKNDEIQVRMQLEQATAPRYDRSPNEPYYNERKYAPDNTSSRDYDDEAENNNGSYAARSPASNMSIYLLIFVIFAIMDVINLALLPTILSALPVIVHGIFLPLLLYIVYKQRRGEVPPSIMITFIQFLIAYMIAYLATEIIVAAIFGNYFTIGIDVFIGACMVIMWSRVLQQMKYVFGRQE